MRSLKAGTVKDKTLVHGATQDGYLVRDDIINYINIVDGVLFWNAKIKGKRIGKPLKNYSCVVSFQGVVYRYKDVEGLVKGSLSHIISSTSPPESYHIWNAMISRCKKNNYPVSEMFSNYNTWISWVRSQKGYNELDFFNRTFSLDSDMFSGGNKTYSEETCVFIPEHLNQIYKTSYKDRDCLGVDFVEGSYRVRIKIFNNQTNVGNFKTKDEAVTAYAVKRAEYIKLLLSMYRHQLEDKTIKFIEDDIKNNIFI